MKPVQQISSIGAWKQGRNSPGEPLYTGAEIAERLGITLGCFTRTMGWHPGLQPWNIAKSNSQRFGKVMFRLSDARKWWAGVKEGAA